MNVQIAGGGYQERARKDTLKDFLDREEAARLEGWERENQSSTCGKRKGKNRRVSGGGILTNVKTLQIGL